MNLRMALYFGAHQFIGMPIGQEYEKLVREDCSIDSIETAKRLLADILSHCRQRVPYYSGLMRNIDPSNTRDPESYLRAMPILTKDLIRENFDRLKSTDLDRRKWQYNTSGGSTGEPVRLIQDRLFAARVGAVQMLSFRWAGREVGQPAVRIWGSERDILQGSMGLKMSLLNRLTNDTWFNAFRMTRATMHRIIDALNVHPPNLIIAYAQAMYELAQFAEQEALLIQPQEAILTSAGTLYPFMRQKIEAVFQCKVFNRYGSREVGDIACECKAHSGLHVFPWTCYVEVLDDDGLAVPEGVEGNIVVTSLANYAMPLVRYSIGDRGALSSLNCTCGRKGQILQNISGRNVDAFLRLDGTLVDGEYFTHLLYFRDWVQKFQVVQKDYDSVVFKIEKTSSECSLEEQNEIVDKTRHVMGEACEVSFEFVSEISVTESGKYRYTISEVHPS